MTVLIALTTAGSSTGPFNLYSNTDNYAAPFETNVPKASLVAGYLSVVVPAGTTIIQVRSLGTCTNSINITIDLLTTSTSSTSTTSTTTTTVPTTTTTTVDPFYYYIANQYTCPNCENVIGTNMVIKSATPLTIGNWVPWSSGGNTFMFNVLSVSVPFYMATLVDGIGASPTCGCSTSTSTTSTTSSTTTVPTTSTTTTTDAPTTTTSTTTTVPTTTSTTSTTTSSTTAPTTTTTTQGGQACSELEIYPPLTPGTTHTVVFLTCEFGTTETINIPYNGTMGSICVQPGGVISDNGAQVNAMTYPTQMVCIGNTTTTTTTTTTAAPATNYRFYRCTGDGVASVIVNEANLVNAGMAPGAILTVANTIEVSGSGNLTSCYAFDDMVSLPVTGQAVISFDQCECLSPA
jgi:hypothetical protein